MSPNQLTKDQNGQADGGRRFTFRTDEEVTLALDRYCIENDRTPSQVIRIALKRYLFRPIE